MTDVEELGTLDADKQIRLDTLMTKNNNGQLSNAEEQELQTLVREAEEIMTANARLLTTRRKPSSSPRPEAGIRAA